MTLKQIAEELGVSYSTVSRVVNGYTKNFSVKPEVRAMILEKVREYNFKPNPLYQTLRQKNNRQITFLFPYSLNAVPGSVVGDTVSALETRLAKMNCLFNYLVDPLSSPESAFHLPPWKAAGLVLADVKHADQLREVENAELPYVVINGICGPGGTAVVTDESWNMRCMLEHLSGLGHRRIAYVSVGFSDRDPAQKHYSQRERLDAYRRFCEEQQMEPLFLETSWDGSFAPCVDQLREHGITAVAAYNTYIAQRLIRALHDSGLTVPGDISVAAFNRHDLAAYMIPSLTTLELPVDEMGSTAADLIVERLKNPDYARGKTYSFRGTLITRESTAKRG